MMKKVLISAYVIFSLFLGSSVANAYTAYFEFGSGIDFDLIDGFDLFTSNDIANPITDLSLTVYYQGATTPTGSVGATPTDFVSGAVKAYDTLLTTYGVTSLRNYYNEIPTWDTNYTTGIVLAITADEAFTLTDIVLNSITLSGKYEGLYNITTKTVSDGIVYTAAVPIPGAVWLLGSGIAGLVALRRKNS